MSETPRFRFVVSDDLLLPDARAVAFTTSDDVLSLLAQGRADGTSEEDNVAAIRRILTQSDHPESVIKKVVWLARAVDALNKQSRAENVSTVEAVAWSISVAELLNLLIERCGAPLQCWRIAAELHRVAFFYDRQSLASHDDVFLAANLDHLEPICTGGEIFTLAFSAALKVIIDIFFGLDGEFLDRLPHGGRPATVLPESELNLFRTKVADIIEADDGPLALREFCGRLQIEATRVRIKNRELFNEEAGQPRHEQRFPLGDVREWLDVGRSTFSGYVNMYLPEVIDRSKSTKLTNDQTHKLLRAIVDSGANRSTRERANDAIKAHLSSQIPL